MAAVLFGMARRNPFESDAEPEPPHGEFAQAIERVRRREGHAVIRAQGVRQAEVLKGALKDAEGVPLLRRRERFTGQEVATRIVADRQRGAVALVAEQKLALVVGAPES